MGLFLPRWLSSELEMFGELLSIPAMKNYVTAAINYESLLLQTAKNRLIWMLLLFFSCYTAAGFWILSAICLLVGWLLGCMAIFSVMQMGYWGIAFLVCVLFPHWVFYGLAGRRIALFMGKRRERMVLCSGNALPAYNWRTFSDFLRILSSICIGIFSEVYLNLWILRYFLQFYLKNIS